MLLAVYCSALGIALFSVTMALTYQLCPFCLGGIVARLPYDPTIMPDTLVIALVGLVVAYGAQWLSKCAK